MIVETLAHAAWLAGALPDWLRYRLALNNPRGAQLTQLRRLLAANAECDFGRTHNFSQLQTVRDFQNAVPIAGYNALAPWIERAMHGEPRVLTTEPVLMFEKTSGTSSAAKYIPYTATLRREFQRAVNAWMVDLYDRRPALATGPAYWSITPLARDRETTPGGIPIGFASDTEYFGPLARRFLAKLLAVPPGIAQARDLDTALDLTRRHLAATPGLRFISVWSPTFLEVLCRPLSDPRKLWPALRMISCWADADAGAAMPSLRALFPHVEIQPKGLLATEGVVSIPQIGQDGAALALTSHFFEFVPEGGGEPRLADELQTGARYSVLLTTGGGLWRYDLGDLVEITGHLGRTPLLRFIGRRDTTSDLCGEKLSAIFVGQVLAQLCPAARFAMLTPHGRDGYALFLEGASCNAAQLDAALSANPHYAYTRGLGQLRAPVIFPVIDAAEKYLRRCLALGQRAGDVKPAALHRRGGWEQSFAAQLCPAPTTHCTDI